MEYLLTIIDINTILIISTILGGVTALWFILDKILKAIKQQKVVFPDSSNSFYEHYAKVIRSAKKEIYITSDGFNMRNSESIENAVLMTEAFRYAMNSNVKVTRLQLTDTMHLNWIDHLKTLKAEFPDLLEIWINFPLPSIPNVCTIDPDQKNCVSEKMQHRLGIFGQGSVPHMFSFYHGDQKVAKQTKQIVIEAIKHPGSKELDLEGLDWLYEELYKKRMKTLEAWSKSQTIHSNEDVSASGVFDEIVISDFVKGKRKYI